MEEPLVDLSTAEPERPPEITPAAEAPPQPRSRWMLVLKTIVIAAVAGVLVLLLYGTLVAGRGSSLVAKIRAGKAPLAPGFNLGVIWPHTGTWPPTLRPAIGDGKLSVTELHGHRVVINFWASWCVPCRDEAPILHAAAIRNRGRVAFVGVDVEDLTGDAVHFAQKYRLNYVSVRDGSGDKTWSGYGLTGVPETYFLDRRGRILAHVPGAVSTQTLGEGIAATTGAARPRPLKAGAHFTP